MDKVLVETGNAKRGVVSLGRRPRRHEEDERGRCLVSDVYVQSKGTGTILEVAGDGLYIHGLYIICV